MHVPVETTATSASSRTFRLLFLVLFLAPAALFLAPAAVDAQWSVRRSADGTVSASAVSPDRVMGVLITCDPAGRSMMVGVGSYLLPARSGNWQVGWWIYPGGNEVVETWDAVVAGGVPSLLAPDPLQFARTLARSSGEVIIDVGDTIASIDLRGSYRAIAQVAAACGWTP